MNKWKKVRAKGFDGKMKTFEVKREGKRVTVKMPMLKTTAILDYLKAKEEV